MKTTRCQMFALLSMMFLFISCQKDAFVESISPDYIETESTELRSPSSVMKFELWQHVDIQKLDCGEEAILAKTSGNNDYKTARTKECKGLYGLSSDEGHGWILEYGRFSSQINLKVNPETNQVAGSILLEFTTEGDRLVLNVMGNATKEAQSNEGHTLIMNVLSKKGTGRFAYTNFSGTLRVKDADKVFAGKMTDYYTILEVQGGIGK